jgi:hypothetical protein
MGNVLPIAAMVIMIKGTEQASKILRVFVTGQ